MRQTKMALDPNTQSENHVSPRETPIDNGHGVRDDFDSQSQQSTRNAQVLKDFDQMFKNPIW
jgi:hypothetical protein